MDPTKDRLQRKLEAEKLKTVRGLFPDESLEVVLRELRASGWVVANAIDALEALRDLRQVASPSSSSSPSRGPHAAQPRSHEPPLLPRPKDDWVVLDAAQQHRGHGLADDGDPDAVAEGVRQVEEALRKSCLWDDPQAFVTAHPPHEPTHEPEQAPPACHSHRGGDDGDDAVGQAAKATEQAGAANAAAAAEERRQRAERQRQMMDEAERRWEEEKQRQAEAELLHARLRQHRERRSSSGRRATPTPGGPAAGSATSALGADGEEVATRPERSATEASEAQRESDDDDGDEEEEEEREEKAREREERERRQVAHAGMIELTRRLARRFPPQQLEAMRAIPFTVTTERAAKIFNDWRLSLWFAPTDFSQLLEAPSVSMTYVPYYCTAVRSVCSYVARVEVTRADGRKEQRLVEGRREANHDRHVCGGAHLRPEVAALLAAIEPWDMETSLPLASPPPSSRGDRDRGHGGDDDDAVSVAALLEPRDVWSSVREWIVAREKEECAKEALLQLDRNEEEGGGGHDDGGGDVDDGDDGDDGDGAQRARATHRRVVETSVARMEYPETRYRVVYVPLYLVRYTQGDSLQGEPREYFFAINALTGKSHGQRPFGVGKLLGRGLSFLEGLLGLKDHHTAQIVTGSQLSQIDRRICYSDKHHYLIWPASHSYVVAYDTGFITLRNCSTAQPIALSSQMRESKEITARYVLRPGETQSFNYRGFWCIRLELANDEGDDRGAASQSWALSRAAAFFFPQSTQAPPVAAAAASAGQLGWEDMIEVVAHSIDQGNHGNLLGMA